MSFLFVCLVYLFINFLPFFFLLFFSNQITIEKTPEYILSQRARDEMYKLTPNVKLIVLVRDPVVRLVSQFLQKYRDILPKKPIPVTVIYRDQATGKFKKDSDPIARGIYYKYISMWFKTFPRGQFLILNSDDLTTNPLSVLKRVERFLEIPAMFREENFYFNKTSGFFCLVSFEENANPKCYGEGKGRKHPELPAEDEKMLYNFYRPFNEKLFTLIGERFKWNTFKYINK